MLTSIMEIRVKQKNLLASLKVREKKANQRFIFFPDNEIPNEM
jgi:hypothetical protein